MAETQTTIPGQAAIPSPDGDSVAGSDVPQVARRLSSVAIGGELVARRERSLWGDAWRRLLRNKMAVVGLIVVTVFTLIAVFAPWIAPYKEAEVVHHQLARYPPSWDWPMGLDQNGRDIFSRLVYGARVSLVVGVLSQLLVLIIGLPIGALAGYHSGKVDNFIMRSVDVVYAVPQILLVMVFLNILGPGLVNIFIAIGVIGWVTLARLVRGQFLALREMEYVNASRVAGAGTRSIITKHLMPNSLTPVIVALTFGIPTAIFTEAALSFVGVGILSPQASWGQMVGGDASQPGYIMSSPHMLLFPVLAIGLTMLGFTFLGDGLRDALDVRGDD